LCNDPCTIDGFREPLRGQFAVVETAREAQLLIQNGRLHGQLSAARRNVSKVEDRLEESDRDLATAMRAASRSGDEILALRAQVITAQEDAAAVRESRHGASRGDDRCRRADARRARAAGRAPDARHWSAPAE
jgi:hypothetical protein